MIKASAIITMLFINWKFALAIIALSVGHYLITHEDGLSVTTNNKGDQIDINIRYVAGLKVVETEIVVNEKKD